MKQVTKNLQKLPKFNTPEPIVTLYRKNTAKIVLLGSRWNSKSEFMSYLDREIPDSFDHINFFVNTWGTVSICITIPETDVEMQTRIGEETRAKEKWENEKKEHEDLIAKLKADQEEEKKKRDEKFKDPEYIEFLRMQKKMKERGFV